MQNKALQSPSLLTGSAVIPECGFSGFACYNDSSEQGNSVSAKVEAATQTVSEVMGDLSKIEASTQTESEYIKELKQLRLMVKDLMMRVSPPPFCEETFTTDECVKFYIGLPNVIR